MIRRIALGVAAAIVAMVVVCAWRASRVSPYRGEGGAVDPSIDSAIATTGRFTAALRFATVSRDDTSLFDPKPFLELHEYLRTAFPRVHAALAREVVNRYSLLYTWPGADPSLDPVLLMAHLDVVPVEPGTELLWKHPPFGGEVADSFVWGRGALDDKASAIAILEAVELLLGQGFTPARTIYLAFGHDEEVGGFAGAEYLAKALRQHTPRVRFLLDEGGVVGQGLIPGVTRPVALVGVAEKAALNVELTVERPGGHSSMPPPHTAVGILSEAITRLERHPMSAHLTPVPSATFTRLAGDMPFMHRMLFANLWLFRPVVIGVMSKNPGAAAMLRTTTAATMVSGSPKANALPIRARAVVNFRILPGETSRDVLEHVRRVIADTSVHVSAAGLANEPSPRADATSPEFHLLEKTIVQLFPQAVPVPFLMIGGTDTRHYESFTRNVYRFNPFVATPELVAGAHGTNERVRAGDFVRGVRFYAQLIKNAQ